MAKTEAQKRAEAAYRKKTRKFELKLTPVDQDMIDWLESKENKQGYLKDIIRKDMTEMAKKNYTFTSTNMGDVDVIILGEYRNGEKEVQVNVDDHEKIFDEIDGGGVDDIFSWLLEVGVEFDSLRSMRFNHRYITSVMIDEDATEKDILDEAATWTDEDLGDWKEWIIS